MEEIQPHVTDAHSCIRTSHPCAYFKLSQKMVPANNSEAFSNKLAATRLEGRTRPVVNNTSTIQLGEVAASAEGIPSSDMAAQSEQLPEAQWTRARAPDAISRGYRPDHRYGPTESEAYHEPVPSWMDRVLQRREERKETMESRSLGGTRQCVINEHAPHHISERGFKRTTGGMFFPASCHSTHLD
eukprot:Rmarinus@m.11464